MTSPTAGQSASSVMHKSCLSKRKCRNELADHSMHSTLTAQQNRHHFPCVFLAQMAQTKRLKIEGKTQREGGAKHAEDGDCKASLRQGLREVARCGRVCSIELMLVASSSTSY